MPLNVYYLDDEAELTELFRELYESADVVVTTFTRPADFVDAVRARAPDLAFVDYRLPGTTGDEVCAGLPPTFPRILVTGEVQLTTVSAFHEILRKPARVDEVTRILAHFAAAKAR